MGVALIGCGRWGMNHVRVWRELGCLRVACDTSAAARAAVAARWPDVATSEDIGAVLARPDVSAVVVATPAATHAALAEQALSAGKDVFVEKPMTLTVTEAERLTQTAARLGRRLAVGHLLEHHPAVVALLELIRDGALGRIRYVYSNRLNFGQIRTEENALWSFAPHDVAVILRIMGRLPEEVRCTGGAYVSPGVADVTLTSMRFSGGEQAHIFVSWLHPYKEQRLVVVGERQMAVFDDGEDWARKLVLYSHDVMWRDGQVPVVHQAEALPVPLHPSEPLRLACRDFITSVRSGRRPLTDGESGLRSVRVLAAAQDSLETGGLAQRLGGSGAAHRVHPTASVHPTARLGERTFVWHHSTVHEGAWIGDDCSLGQNTFVARDVRIGDRVRIQNNVSVYQGVELEDDVFCGPSAVFTNVQRPRAHINRKHEFQRTLVRRGVTLGANATIVCGVTLGRYAFVAAGAVVTRDIPDHALVVGSPARVVGWVCSCGEKLTFEGASSLCWRCSRRFTLEHPEGPLTACDDGGCRLEEPV